MKTAKVKQLALKTLPKINNTLIMQGNMDKEVEPKQSWKIYELMQRPKEYHIIDGAGHPYNGYEDRVVDLALMWFGKFLK